MLLAFSGRRESGKSSCVEFLTRNAYELFPVEHAWDGDDCTSAPRVQLVPMAKPMKDFCENVLGVPREHLWGTNEQKDSPTRYRWEDLPHYHRVEAEKYAEAKSVCLGKYGTVYSRDQLDAEYATLLPKGLMTARQLMQQVSDMVKLIDPFCWLRAWRREVASSTADVVFCDDVRFPYEVDAVRKDGGYVVRLGRVAHPGDTHNSEVSLDPDRYDWGGFDLVVGNQGMTVGETTAAVARWLQGKGLACS